MNVLEKGRAYRLGLDVGSNSIGWFVVWLDASKEPESLGTGGVRIFPDGRDPQSKTSNAVQRREARGARRRRDRYLLRRKRLMGLLVTHGLMPVDVAERKKLESRDPYKARAQAAEADQVPLYDVGRAIFHLNQRRGFLSNRKTETPNDESGAISLGASKLKSMMDESGASTLGQFLHQCHEKGQPVRARNNAIGKTDYEFYPTRGLYEIEFDTIWNAQSAFYPDNMTQEAHDLIRGEIFYQRPLKPQQVGKCTLDPASSINDEEGFRCPRAHPLAQRFKIWQEVRNLAVLKVGEAARPLTKEEGDKVALALIQNGQVSFSKLKTLLKLSPEVTFNLESEKRPKLTGDETAAKLAAKKMFGKDWRSFELERQIKIVNRLLNEEDPNKLAQWLSTDNNLDQSALSNISSAILPDGHSRLGLRAIKAILPHLIDGKNYPDAAASAGYDHAILPTGEQSTTGRLPYYGEWLKDDLVGSGDPNDSKEKRWGKFPNPTVHIGLGQIRRVVNALISKYGAPEQIVIELARDFKLSPKQVAEIEREQVKNQRLNEERNVELRALGHAQNFRNRLKLRLWEELNSSDALDRQCPYTGEKISITRLLSEEVEIDHILPFKDSLDDSASNKVVCIASSNRAKKKQTPFEAFGNLATWPEILQRAGNLPKSKRWRFGADARSKMSEEAGFLARQLNETAWLARLSKKYLMSICDPNSIWTIPGRHTAMLRSKWGLNDLLPDHNFSDAKNRKDHRHHAIDALVVAMTSRSLLQKISSAYDEDRQKIEVPLPWPGLRENLRETLEGMTVSHKPRHNVQGKLHEATAYGLVREADTEGGTVVYRKALVDLKPTEIRRIRDPRLRSLIEEHIPNLNISEKELQQALISFGNRSDIKGLPNGVRRVRLLKSEDQKYLTKVKLNNPPGFKAYSSGENAYVEIYETGEGKWRGEAVSRFDANKPSHSLKWRELKPQPKLVMRIYKGDLIAIDEAGKRVITVVHQLDVSAQRFKLAGHNETGVLQKRHSANNQEDPFRWFLLGFNTLKTRNAEKVRVDELGKVWRVKD